MPSLLFTKCCSLPVWLGGRVHQQCKNQLYCQPEKYVQVVFITYHAINSLGIVIFMRSICLISVQLVITPLRLCTTHSSCLAGLALDMIFFHKTPFARSILLGFQTTIPGGYSYFSDPTSWVVVCFLVFYHQLYSVRNASQKKCRP